MEQVKVLSEKNYINNKDLLPTNQEERNWGIGNYFSIWMGSVHNVPSYVTIGGFFALGLSIEQVFWAIMTAASILAAVLILNGHAGGKYGIPFSMLIRASYGVKGAIIPGVLRGCIAAIMWFGFQTYAGSLALSVLIGKIWPPYLLLGGSWDFFGLRLSSLISFLLFWALNVLFIFGGMTALGKFTKLLTPLVYVTFGGMAIWSIMEAGGIDSILRYSNGLENNRFLMFCACVSSILATWAAQIVSVSDFTRVTRSNKAQAVGQALGIIFTYLLFAFASIAIIVGSEIAFGTQIWNIIDVINLMPSHFAILLSVLTICLTTLSVNVVANIIPAGYQMSALFTRFLNYQTGALIAAILGMVILPWRLMENSTSIFTFLNIIGGLLSPVAGIMLAHYFVISNKHIDLDELYLKEGGQYEYFRGYNIAALTATIISGGLSLAGQFILYLKPLYDVSWFSGTFLAFVIYIILFRLLNKK